MTNHEQCTLGWRLIDEGKPAEAAEQFGQVLARDPNYAAALHGRGWLERCAGRLAAAEALLSRALRAEPKRAEAHFHLAVVCQQMHHEDRAIACVRRAVELERNDVEYRAALASLLQDKGLIREAETVAREALRLEPRRAATLAGLSYTLCAAGDVRGAVECARRAVALDDKLPMAHLKLGFALKQSNELSAAEAALRRAIELEPANAEAHVHLAMVLLGRGRMEEGWREWEWRRRLPSHKLPDDIKSLPWDGVPHRGETLLVQAEQGFGDSIQFARFLPILAEQEMRVVTRVPRAVTPLMRSVEGVAEAVPHTAPPPAHEWHTVLGSLPGQLGVTAETIPRRVPYVSVEPARREIWSQRLAGLARPIVGIAWAGNPDHTLDFLRSIPVAMLKTIFDAVPGLTWISLQVETRGLTPAGLVDFTAEIKDFADGAALVDCLDLVISVDTATAHLAGALAKPVWTLLPYAPDWRWMLQRNSTPWYPTMRLFRQSAPGDWEGVLREVAEALQHLHVPS